MSTHLQMTPWTLGFSFEVYSARSLSKSDILCFWVEEESIEEYQSGGCRR